MFLGTHTPRLDEKGRLFLPAKYREEVQEGVVITKGQDRCLYVFPLAEFARQAAELEAAERAAVTPEDKKRTRMRTRQTFGSASDETPDRQGRITVPAALRAYAGLDRACTVVGANTRLEIWDSAAWEAFNAASDAAFAEELDEEPLD